MCFLVMAPRALSIKSRYARPYTNILPEYRVHVAMCMCILCICIGMYVSKNAFAVRLRPPDSNEYTVVECVGAWCLRSKDLRRLCARKNSHSKLWQQMDCT